MRTFWNCFIMLVLLFGGVHIVSAETISGTDDTITWTLDLESGTLFISGEGAMKDYKDSSDASDIAPWLINYREKISRIYIDKGVTTIGANSFVDCKNLKRVQLSEVQSIGEKAFKNCQSLISVVLPAGLTKVGEESFYGCTKLEMISIPSGVKTIPSRTFYGCSSLSTITLSEGLEEIGTEAFKECIKLKEISIPDGVDVIPSGAFYGCTSLLSVSLPDGLKSIGNYAFYNCSFQEIQLPNSISEIGEGAFYQTKLRNISLPKELKSINKCLFYQCRNLTDSIAIPEGVTSIGERAFTACSITAISIPETVTSIGVEAFRQCGYLRSFTFPKNMEYISEGVLRFCGKLTDVKLPDNLIEIGPDAFSSSGSLSSIVFPKGLITIRKFAFANCALKSVEFPEGMRNIEHRAFLDCNSLTKIIIPRTIKFIGEWAFLCSIDPFSNPSPRTVRNWSRIPQDIEQYTFQRYETSIIPSPQDTLYVATGCKELYEAADYWNQFVIIEDATDVPNMPLERYEKGRLFDLSGRPADEMQKGFLIKDGKKVLIK